MKQKTYTQGYSLVEALVAISIIVFVTSIPFVHIKTGLYNSAYAREQKTAIVIAEEGIELIRMIRDTNRLSGDPHFNYMNSCIGGNSCEISRFSFGTPTALGSITTTMRPCSVSPSTCGLIQYSNGAYRPYTTRGEGTIYKRIVTMHQISPNELRVDITVTWSGNRDSAERTVGLSEFIRSFE